MVKNEIRAKEIISEPILEVHDLTATYNRKPVLYGIDFKITKPELIGIMGPNGAGKSTLVKAIVNMLPLNTGWINIDGKNVKKYKNNIAYVPQKENIDWDFPVNVLDVVLMGTYVRLKLFQRPGKKERNFALHCLDQVGMLPYAKRQISNLSGGQQQRVFIARALAQKSNIFLLDEPFAGVDVTTESKIIELLRKLKSENKTIIVVHHDLSNASEYFDKLILLNTQLVAFGKTNDVLSEENLKKTYGGKLTILSDVISSMSKK